MIGQFKTIFYFLILLLLVLTLQVCHYHIKPVLPSHIKTTAVGEFSNKTVMYELSSILTEKLLSEIQIDGSLKIESITKADSIFSGEITNYRKEPVSFYEDKTVKEFAVYIEVKFNFYDNITKKDIKKNQNISRVKNFYVMRDTSKEAVAAQQGIYYTEDETLNAILKEIAEEILNRVLEEW